MYRLILTTFLFIHINFLFADKNQQFCVDTLEVIHIQNIFLTGNKITHDKIIFRELNIKEGDSLCIINYSSALSKSKANILNTSLFNFVDIIDSTFYVQNKLYANIYITLHERWYIWPMPVFELADRNPNAWWETKDFSKINYALFFTWENFRGRREALKLTFQGGYDEKFQFHYDIPFINKPQTLGLVLGAGLTRNHEVTYQTEQNKPVRFRDEQYLRYQYYSYAAMSIRKNMHTMHYFGVEYADHVYNDLIFDLNPHFDPNQKKIFQFFSLTYKYKNDHRDNNSFPLNGHYLDISLVKRGLGILKNESVDIVTLTGNIKKYWNLQNNWYLAGGFTGRIANTSKNPYFLNTGLGYNSDYVRGFQHYVIDGQNFALIKTDLKYGIIQDKIMNLPVLPSKFSKIHWSIYLNLFADAAYSSSIYTQPTNTLQNKSLVGYGAGINFVSYYDIVIRLEYARNNIGEDGLFISFISAI